MDIEDAQMEVMGDNKATPFRLNVNSNNQNKS